MSLKAPGWGCSSPLVIFAAIALLIVAYIRSQPKHASQGARTESEWRIHSIPYGESWKNNWRSAPGAVAISIGGMVMFVGGIVLVLASEEPAVFVVSGVGVILLILGTLNYHRGKRRDWVRVKAVCLDREHKRVWRPGRRIGMGGYTWAFRLLCKFDLNGKEYMVTPWFWRTCFSERGVERIYGKLICEDDTCFLCVNPRNPLESELCGGITDFLLH